MNLQKLLQMGHQMQSRLSDIQATLGKREISASSGGGMVTVTVDGNGDVRRVAIDPAVVNPADVEMLEDLVLAALSQAQKESRGIYEEEMKKVTGGLPFPFRIPGL
jgi:DNA-binding YbaB/EbfC family protein